jgi:hypothetical protein
MKLRLTIEIEMPDHEFEQELYRLKMTREQFVEALKEGIAEDNASLCKGATASATVKLIS